MEKPDENIEEFPFLLIEELDLKTEQENDDWCRNIKYNVELSGSDKYKIIDGVLYKRN